MDDNIVVNSNGFDCSQTMDDDQNLKETSFSTERSQIVENDLFLSLKFHLDFQFKLSQLNQSRIRSFERFRKYCQQVTQLGHGTTVGKQFDQEQFQNEYKRLDRNDRYWRKRIRKLRKETKSSMTIGHQSPYDILYELFVKLESFEISNDNQMKKPNDHINQEIPQSSSSTNLQVNQSQSNKDQSIQHDNCDGHKINLTTKRRRGRPPKTKDTTIQYLSSEQLNPEIPINVIDLSESNSKSLQNVPVNNDIDSNSDDDDYLPDDNGMLNYSSDSSEDISEEDKSTRSRRQTNQTKKSTVSKKIAMKDKLQKTTVLEQEVSSDPDCADNFSKRVKPKKPKKVFVCDYVGCHHSTTISSNLKLHMKSHSDERPFKCDKCDFAFKMKADLNRHQNIHERKRFWCSFEGCKVNYATVKRLQAHVKVFHNNNEGRLLHCQWEGCQYTTYSQEYLTIHRKIHTDERRYKCPECSMTFKTKNNLYCHKMKHDKGRLLKCDFEGCSYTTNVNWYMKVHKVIHKDERPYSCPWPGCGDSFKTSSSLGKHKLMHENLRLNKCHWEGCSFASNVSSGLRTHIKTVHEKKERKPRKRKCANDKKPNLPDSSLEEFPKTSGESSSSIDSNKTNCLDECQS